VLSSTSFGAADGCESALLTKSTSVGVNTHRYACLACPQLNPETLTVDAFSTRISGSASRSRRASEPVAFSSFSINLWSCVNVRKALDDKGNLTSTSQRGDRRFHPCLVH
jgi:hypothetical protein